MRHRLFIYVTARKLPRGVGLVCRTGREILAFFARLACIRPSLCTVFFTVALIASEAAAESTTLSFDIPRQNAGDALPAFGQQADISVVYQYDQVKDHQTNALQGEYSIPDAVAILLEETDLKARFDGESHLIITRTDDRKGIMMKMKKSILAGAIGFLAGAGSVQTLVAQETAGAVTLEEIVVTAEKRAESVQDIPVSISAFSGELAIKSGVKGMKDLVHIAPSMNFGDTDGNSFISIRGIGSDVPNGGAEPGVTVTQDGVPYLTQYLFDANFMDIERIEVLRGPQGTIAGRNATGGALNIISNTPSEDFAASTKITLGDYNHRQFEGFINGQVADGLDARLAYNIDRADGYIRNRTTGQELNNRDRSQFRLSLRADVTDNLEGLLIIEHESDGRDTALSMMHDRILSDQPSPAEALGITEAPDFENLEFSSPDNNNFEVDTTSVILKMSYDLGESSTLTSTTGFIDYLMEASGDFDGTPLRLSDIPFLEIDHQQISQELTYTTDLTEDMDLILGALYLKADLDFPLEFASADGFGFGRGLLTHQDHQEMESYAVYGQWRYQLNDEWRLAIGGRYTRDSKEYLNDGVVFGGTLNVTGDESWSSFTPKVTLDYQPSDQETIYVSIAKGFKAGGFNSFQPTVADEFDPEELINYELGHKRNWMDNRVKTTVAAFYMDYENIQQNIFVDVSPNVVNAGDATIMGVEAELDALLSDNFRLRGNITVMDSEFGEFFATDPSIPAQGEVNINGNQLSRAPDLQAALGFEHSLSLTDQLDLITRADYAYKDRVFHSFFNYENVGEDAYGIINTSLELVPGSDEWALRLFGTNLTDKRYISNSFTSNIGPNYKNAAVGEPRLYGVSFTYNF